MRVIALSDGFINGARIRAGAVFEVPDGVTGKWFIPADSEKSARPKKPKPEKVIETFSEMSQRDGSLMSPTGY